MNDRVDRPLVDNAADRKQLEEAKVTERTKEKNILDDIGWLMSEPRGRRFMAWLLDQCGMDKLSWTGNSETFFREGCRNIGIQLKVKIDEIGPELYIKMLSETLERNQNGRSKR